MDKKSRWTARRTAISAGIFVVAAAAIYLLLWTLNTSRPN